MFDTEHLPLSLLLLVLSNQLPKFLLIWFYFFANVAFAVFEYRAMSLFLDATEINPPFSVDFKMSFSSFASFMFFSY